LSETNTNTNTDNNDNNQNTNQNQNTQQTNQQTNTQQTQQNTQQTQAQTQTQAPETVSKSEFDAMKKLLEDTVKGFQGKINEYETQNNELKFENTKTKLKAQFGVDDDVFEMLGITMNTKEETAVKKLEKFKTYATAPQTSNFQSPVFATSTDDTIKKLYKEGKVKEALEMQIKMHSK
jgi:hypothetical protein